MAAASPIINQSEYVNTEMLLGSDGAAVAEHILRLIQVLLGIWRCFRPDNIKIRKIATAMTNHVYVITVSNYSDAGYDETLCEEAEPEQLLLRVYGSSPEGMFERMREMIASCKLSEAGVIPRWYGIFGNGRFEEYILSDQVRAPELRQVSAATSVIRQLARVHRTLDAILEEPNVGWVRKDYLWDRMESWRKEASASLIGLKEKYKTDEHKLEMLRKMEESNIASPELLAEVREKTLSSEPEPLLVFGHCDLHHGNILYKASSNEYVIIDFEYSIPTSRGFDLANFFNEFCADYDDPHSPATLHEEWFPTAEEMKGLVEAYLTATDREDCEEDVKQLCQEVIAHLPVASLYWAYWCLFTDLASNKSSKFDYLLAGHLRFQRFLSLTGGSFNE